MDMEREEILQHWGVKGMKWKEDKKKQEQDAMDNARSFDARKKQEVYNEGGVERAKTAAMTNRGNAQIQKNTADIARAKLVVKALKKRDSSTKEGSLDKAKENALKEQHRAQVLAARQKRKTAKINTLNSKIKSKSDNQQKPIKEIRGLNTQKHDKVKRILEPYFEKLRKDNKRRNMVPDAIESIIKKFEKKPTPGGPTHHEAMGIKKQKADKIRNLAKAVKKKSGRQK